MWLLIQLLVVIDIDLWTSVYEEAMYNEIVVNQFYCYVKTKAGKINSVIT